MSNKHKWADVIHAFAEGKEIQWRFISLKSGEISIWEDIPKIQDPQFNNPCIEWRIKPHKYQDVIDAYVRGETVQYYCINPDWNSGWLDVVRGKSLDVFDSGHEYRIKPKPDIRVKLWRHDKGFRFHLTFVFDGETKAFKTVEYHDD